MKRYLLISGLLFLAFCLGIVVQKKSIPSKIKNKWFLKSVEKKSTLQKPANFQLDSIQIFFKEKAYEKLKESKAKAVEKGTLVDTDEVTVKAKLAYKSDTSSARIKLKGRGSDHFNSDLTSLKISLKDGVINGMTTFSIQHPKTRAYLNEWYFHQLMREVGVISLTYDFALVSVNEKSYKLYALEEKFDRELLIKNNRVIGPIFKFDNDIFWSGKRQGLPKNRIDAAEILPYGKSNLVNDSIQLSYFVHAKSLLEKFKRNEVKTSEIFDSKLLANYFAIFDLLGYHHGCSLDNMKFYYNPESKLIEPIPYDNQNIHDVSKQLLLGFHKQLGTDIVSQENRRWGHCKWYEYVFKDPVFYNDYITALVKISGKQFISDFNMKIEKELEVHTYALSIYYPNYKNSIDSILGLNQFYIKSALNPSDKSVIAYLAKINGQEIELNIKSILGFPVIIDAIVNEEEEEIASSDETMLQAVPFNQVPGNKLMKFNISGNEKITKENLNKYKIRFKVSGLNNYIYGEIRLWND